jgi:hypothetical protein
VLADRLGLDVIGLREHHRTGFAIAAPDVALAAIAARTTRIRLGSAVTVLSSDDPIRVFQRFSMRDAVSNGRALLLVALDPFAYDARAYAYGSTDRLQRLPAHDRHHHPLSTNRRQTGFLVHFIRSPSSSTAASTPSAPPGSDRINNPVRLNI